MASTHRLNCEYEGKLTFLGLWTPQERVKALQPYMGKVVRIVMLTNARAGLRGGLHTFDNCQALLVAHQFRDGVAARTLVVKMLDEGSEEFWALNVSRMRSIEDLSEAK